MKYFVCMKSFTPLCFNLAKGCRGRQNVPDHRATVDVQGQCVVSVIMWSAISENSVHIFPRHDKAKICNNVV